MLYAMPFPISRITAIPESGYSSSLYSSSIALFTNASSHPSIACGGVNIKLCFVVSEKLLDCPLPHLGLNFTTTLGLSIDCPQSGSVSDWLTMTNVWKPDRALKYGKTIAGSGYCHSQLALTTEKLKSKAVAAIANIKTFFTLSLLLFFEILASL